MKQHSEKDSINAPHVELIYCLEEYKLLVDDFIYRLHEAEIWSDEKRYSEKELCVLIKVYFKPEITSSLEDNSLVVHGIGIEVGKIGKIHENNALGVSSKTSFN